MGSWIVFTLISTSLGLEPSYPMLKRNEVKTLTPFQFFVDDKDGQTDPLKLQLGLQRQYHSYILKNTISIETNFTFPLYQSAKDMNFDLLSPTRLLSPMQVPSELQLGFNFRLFF